MTSWRDELPDDIPSEDILAAAVGEAQRRRRRRHRRASLASAVGLAAVALAIVVNSPVVRNRSPNAPLQRSLSQAVTRSATVNVAGVSHAVAPPRSTPPESPTRTGEPAAAAPPLPGPTAARTAPPGASTTTGPPTTVPRAPAVADLLLPSADRQPYGITPGPDGTVWFTEYNAGVARLKPGGMVTEFAVPTANSGTYGIAKGPDGNLWFTEYRAGNIGRDPVGLPVG